MRDAEKVAHNVLAEHRINPRREFFEIIPGNNQYFEKQEKSNYDQTTMYLDALIEQIEDGFRYFNLKFLSTQTFEHVDMEDLLKHIVFI